MASAAKPLSELSNAVRRCLSLQIFPNSVVLDERSELPL